MRLIVIMMLWSFLCKMISFSVPLRIVLFIRVMGSFSCEGWWEGGEGVSLYNYSVFQSK